MVCKPGVNSQTTIQGYKGMDTHTHTHTHTHKQTHTHTYIYTQHITKKKKQQKKIIYITRKQIKKNKNTLLHI